LPRANQTSMLQAACTQAMQRWRKHARRQVAIRLGCGRRHGPTRAPASAPASYSRASKDQEKHSSRYSMMANDSLRNTPRRLPAPEPPAGFGLVRFLTLFATLKIDDDLGDSRAGHNIRVYPRIDPTQSTWSSDVHCFDLPVGRHCRCRVWLRDLEEIGRASLTDRSPVVSSIVPDGLAPRSDERGFFSTRQTRRASAARTAPSVMRPLHPRLAWLRP